MLWRIKAVLAYIRIRVFHCTRYDCDTCPVFGGCIRWGYPDTKPYRASQNGEQRSQQ